MAAESSGELRNQQWLFDSKQLSSPSGVVFAIRYVGYLPVRVSMRSLDFEHRKELCRFGTSILAELAGLRVPLRRGADERFNTLLTMVSCDEARLICANAHLAISTAGLRLVFPVANGETASGTSSFRYTQFTHDLSSVSFAAGGEGETLDFVAFVSNEPTAGGRSCHVLECPGGLANQIVVTIGQAFEVRRSSHIAAARDVNAPQNASRSVAVLHSSNSSNFNVPSSLQSSSDWLDNPNFKATSTRQSTPSLNASLDGQSPNPFAVNKPTLSQSRTAIGSNATPADAAQGLPPIPQLPPPMGSLYLTGTPPSAAMLAARLQQKLSAKVQSEPLINFDGEAQSQLQAAGSVNAVCGNDSMNASFSSSTSGALVSRNEVNDTAAPNGDPNEPPASCAWYHGVISRRDAEQLLKADGDFLVRASANAACQYVLTACHAGQPKHLLLVDPTGRVRTSDREFDSVQHLIDYHVDNRVPIVSHDSQLLLCTPLTRASHGSFK